MVVDDPVEHGVGRADNQGGAAAAVGQGQRDDILPLGEGVEVAGVGGGKGAGDGLVGIAHAHPVAVGAGELVEQNLLQGHAVLGFVFEDVGPAPAQLVAEAGAGFQQPGGFPDEVVKVVGALAGEDGLVTAVYLRHHP
jgi:hypothetical protein